MGDRHQVLDPPRWFNDVRRAGRCQQGPADGVFRARGRAPVSVPRLLERRSRSSRLCSGQTNTNRYIARTVLPGLMYLTMMAASDPNTRPTARDLATGAMANRDSTWLLNQVMPTNPTKQPPPAETSVRSGSAIPCCIPPRRPARRYEAYTTTADTPAGSRFRLLL